MEPNKRRKIFWALDILQKKLYSVFFKIVEEAATVAQKGIMSGEFVSSLVRRRLYVALAKSRGKTAGSAGCREQRITSSSYRALFSPWPLGPTKKFDTLTLKKPAGFSLTKQKNLMNSTTKSSAKGFLAPARGACLGQACDPLQMQVPGWSLRRGAASRPRARRWLAQGTQAATALLPC